MGSFLKSLFHLTVVLFLYETGHSSLKSIQMESLGRKSTAEPFWPDQVYPLRDVLENSMLTQFSIKSLFHYSKFSLQ